MVSLSFPRSHDINQGVTEFTQTPGALLLDVRTPQEYRGGHIPGSRNLPLQSISNAQTVAGDKEAPLFVYCQSGGRSAQAVSVLRQMGYQQVKNLGGISAYTGKVEA